MGREEYNQVVGALSGMSDANVEEVAGQDEVGRLANALRRVATPPKLMPTLRKHDPTGRLWEVGIRLPNATAQVAVAAAGTATLSYTFTVTGTVLRAVSASPDLDIVSPTLANEPLSPQGTALGMFVWDPRLDRSGLDPMEGLPISNNAILSGTVVNPTATAVFFRLDIIVWSGRLPTGQTLRDLIGN